MSDEWLSTTIVMCDEQTHLEAVAVDRVELQKRLEQLYWHNMHAARINEAARQLKKSKEAINE